MGGFHSSTINCRKTRSSFVAEATARSNKIDFQLSQYRMLMKNEIQVVVFGDGNSDPGKILKQMELVHGHEFFLGERACYKKSIFSHAVYSIRIVLETMSLLGVALASGSITRGINIGTLVLPLDDSPLPDETVHTFVVLNDDPGVRSVADWLERHFDDIVVYYLNALDRVLPPQYVPTDEDIFRVHISTKGVAGTQVVIGELIYRFVDLSGLRSNLKKRSQHFEHALALVIAVSLATYDHAVSGDTSTSIMQEALIHFDAVCHAPWFAKTSVLLILENTGLFA